MSVSASWNASFTGRVQRLFCQSVGRVGLPSGGDAACFPVKLKFHGTDTATTTRTLWMRLSCNFANVYTIVYHPYSIRTRVHARIPNGHPREEKCASDKSPRTDKSAGLWQAERAARAAAVGLQRRVRQQADFRARRTRRLPRARILARKSARKSVSVSVSFSCNLSFSLGSRVRAGRSVRVRACV